MSRFANRTILVTGAGSGLGLATANCLVNDGATVVAFDLAFSGALSGRVLRRTVDVRDRDGLRAAVRDVRAATGPFDGLATFAGIEMPGRIDRIDPEDWRRVFDINVIGSANAVNVLLADLVHSGRGSIVLCSSQLSLAGGRDCVAYAASKGAINALCRSLAIDHAESGVRVNAVAPGATETPMMTRAFSEVSNATIETARQRHALGRFGTAAETAAATAFLLSDEASFVTGVILPVDGGWSAA